MDLSRLLDLKLDGAEAPSQSTVATWTREGSLGPTLFSQVSELALILGCDIEDLYTTAQTNEISDQQRDPQAYREHLADQQAQAFEDDRHSRESVRRDARRADAS